MLILKKIQDISAHIVHPLLRLRGRNWCSRCLLLHLCRRRLHVRHHLVHHLRIDWRRHQCSPNSEEHHSIPLLVRPCLLLFLRHLLQVSNFLQPCYSPVDITVFIDIETLVRCYWHRASNWEAHAHHWEIRVKCKRTVSAVSVRESGLEQSDNVRWVCSRRIWCRLSTCTCFITWHWWRDKLVSGGGGSRSRSRCCCVGVVKVRLCSRRYLVSRTVVSVRLLRRPRLLLVLLLADTMNTGTWVNVLVDGPVRSLATVSQWSWNLLETWVQREVVSDRILQRGMWVST